MDVNTNKSIFEKKKIKYIYFCRTIMALLGWSHFENFKRMDGVEVSCGKSRETLLGAVNANEAIVRRLRRTSLQNKTLIIHLGDNDVCKEIGRQRLRDGKLEDLDKTRVKPGGG
jgi:hypothetical protein